MKTIEIDVNDIVTNENSRVNYKEQDLAELMGSIKSIGLLEPIGVRKMPDSSFYETVYGNRRLEAIRKLGWPTISAIVYMDLSDIDRDLMNLQENMKRTNTSAFEDGRMFNSLIERGLTESELAAKLGISVPRVQTALEIFRQIPKDFQKKVVFAKKGNTKEGTVAASSASIILNIKKSLHLTQKDTSKLLTFASTDKTNKMQLQQIAPLVKRGYSVEEAIQYAEHYKPVRLDILMPKTVILKLEKQEGRSITDLLLDYLCEEKAFKIKRRRGAGKYVAFKQNGSRIPRAAVATDEEVA
jgi:ParB/RepB/Spo0J family partition protein